MGNQMSQIAAVIGYADKYGMEYCFPNHTIDPDVSKVYFPDLPTFHGGDRAFPIYKEHPTQIYRPIPFMTDICLQGYFQSENYFIHCQEKVRNAFNFSYKLIKEVIGIQVRRGDYFKYPDKHPVQSIEWLEKAMDYFRSRGYCKFLVSSDDLPWCKENLNSQKYPYYIFSYTDPDEKRSMELLSSCEHQIISPSIYGWWAAWLNQNPNKIVLAPKIWTLAPSFVWDTSDICPANWIRM